MNALVTGERDPKAKQAFGVQSIPLLPGSPCLCLLLYLPSVPCREIRLASTVQAFIPGLCLRQADVMENSAWLVLASVFFLSSLQPSFSLASMIYI